MTRRIAACCAGDKALSYLEFEICIACRLAFWISITTELVLLGKWSYSKSSIRIRIRKEHEQLQRDPAAKGPYCDGRFVGILLRHDHQPELLLL